MYVGGDEFLRYVVSDGPLVAVWPQFHLLRGRVSGGDLVGGDCRCAGEIGRRSEGNRTLGNCRTPDTPKPN